MRGPWPHFDNKGPDPFFCCLKEGYQLEAHLTTPEGEELDHERIGIASVPGVDEGRRAPLLPGFVDRIAVLVEELLEVGTRNRR